LTRGGGRTATDQEEMIAVKHSLYAFQQAVGRSLHTLKFAGVVFPVAPLSSPGQHSIKRIKNIFVEELPDITMLSNSKCLGNQYLPAQSRGYTRVGAMRSPTTARDQALRHPNQVALVTLIPLTCPPFGLI